MKDKFVFFRSFYEALNLADDATALAVYKAICAYAFDGIEPELDGTAKMIWLLVRPILSASAEHSSSGKRGGRPVERGLSEIPKGGFSQNEKGAFHETDEMQKGGFSQNAQNEKGGFSQNEKGAFSKTRESEKGGFSQNAQKVKSNKDKDKDMDKDMDKECLAELPVPLVSRQAADAQQHAPKEHFDYRPYVDFFNQECDRCNAAIPRVTRKLTDARAAMLRARVSEHGCEAVFKAFTNAAESSFLNGGGPRGWKANIDWILRPNNFAKVLEGTYANSARAAPAQTGYEVGRILTDNRIDKYDNEETKWE